MKSRAQLIELLREGVSCQAAAMITGFSHSWVKQRKYYFIWEHLGLDRSELSIAKADGDRVPDFITEGKKC